MVAHMAWGDFVSEQFSMLFETGIEGLAPNQALCMLHRCPAHVSGIWRRTVEHHELSGDFAQRARLAGD